MNAMTKDIELLNELGGLHDALIEEMTWRHQDGSLTITVRDLHSNVAGLPEHPGVSRGTVCFKHVSAITGESGPFVGSIRISGIEVEFRDEALQVRLALSEPGADLRLRCEDIRVSVLA